MMRRILYTLVLALIASTLTHAQCNAYFAYQEGDVFEQTTYDAKGKEQDRQTMKIMEVIDGIDMTTYKVNASSSMSKKGESYDLEFTCEDGVFRFDGQNLLESVMKQMQAEGMEVTMEGETSSYPADMSVGDQLNETSFTMTMSGNMEGMSMDVVTTIAISDRKVVESTSITTDAGTFDCLKINYTMTSTSEVMGMTQSSITSGVEYVAKRVGVVRSEIFDNKGKLITRNELTKTSL